MKLIKINPLNVEKKKIEQAINVLENDGMVIYPTDTIYGLGANIFSDKAIKKVYSLKHRPYNKPLSVCVSEIKDIHKIAYLDPDEQTIQQILPGPFTIILKKKECISPLLTGGGDKIGIRIPDNKICRELARKFPITTTSANLSGKPAPESLDEIIEQLGDSVDLIIDGGRVKGAPSTVMDWTTTPPKVLRKSLKGYRGCNK
jgi:L-threonylcarbamoyladenylate synthase